MFYFNNSSSLIESDIFHKMNQLFASDSTRKRQPYSWNPQNFPLSSWLYTQKFLNWWSCKALRHFYVAIGIPFDKAALPSNQNGVDFLTKLLPYLTFCNCSILSLTITSIHSCKDRTTQVWDWVWLLFPIQLPFCGFVFHFFNQLIKPMHSGVSESVCNCLLMTFWDVMLSKSPNFPPNSQISRYFLHFFA